ncbi:MAG: tripartite tricarboxylate transporter TctB family protein [Azospirillaceae bacterium]
MTRAADIATTLALLALGLAAVAIASGYPPGARLVPTIVGAGLVAVAALQLVARGVQALRPLVAERDEAGAADRPTGVREWARAGAAIAAVAGLFALVALGGIVFGITAFVPIALRALGRPGPVFLAVATAVAFAVAYGVFVGLMELPLAGGLLG